MRRIGWLSPATANEGKPNLDAFRAGLHERGYVDGRNITIEARWADDRFDRLPALAAELVRLNVELIVAAPTPAVRAVAAATRTIPIVMAFAGDPVGAGFATSLARPGGNITGHSAAVAEMAVKRVEYLKTIVPRLSSVAHVINPEIVVTTIIETEAAGRAVGVHVLTLTVRNPRDIDQMFSVCTAGWAASS